MYCLARDLGFIQRFIVYNSEFLYDPVRMNLHITHKHPDAAFLVCDGTMTCPICKISETKPVPHAVIPFANYWGTTREVQALVMPITALWHFRDRVRGYFGENNAAIIDSYGNNKRFPSTRRAVDTFVFVASIEANTLNLKDDFMDCLRLIRDKTNDYNSQIN